MNTFLSSTQIERRDKYRSFAVSEIKLYVEDLEKHKIDLKKLLKKIGSTGYLGISTPKPQEGSAESFLAQILFVEAISEFDAGLALTLAGHCSLTEMIAKFGTEQQKTKYLPRLATGEMIGAIAVSEENAGSDFNAVQTKLEGGETVKLSGRKTWVVNGEIASVILVLGKSAEGNLSFCIVDVPENSSSIEIFANREKLGLRSAYTNDIEFKNCVLTKDAQLPTDNSAEQVLYSQDISKTIIAGAAIGLLEGALKQASDRARTREQFGAAISQFQGIQWKIADHSTELAGARLMTYRAAWSKDQHPEEFRRYAAMAKLFASRAARLHSGETLQIFGAAGIEENSVVEKLYRDAKVMEICEGTNEMQKVLIAKEMG